MSCSARLHRLFPKSGRLLNVAIDHGFFGERSFLDGIEDMKEAITAVVAAKPDAVQLTVGQAMILQSISGPKPALVLRTDTANVYGKTLPEHLFSELLGDAVLQAVRLDAACVVVNLFDIPNQPHLKQQCIQNICKLKADCERYGMPLMIEPLVMQTHQAGGYAVDGDVDKILPLVRQAVELGADVIKADPTSNTSDYHKVIKVASGKPVLVRGGTKASEEEIFRRSSEVMRQGASGLVYGRNIIQHPNPSAITRAFMAIVHQDASPEEALDILRSHK